MKRARTPCTPRTPGPWHVGGTFMPGTPDETCNVWGATPPGCQSGDQVAQHVRPLDALMIAAAPELHEVLAELLACASPHDPHKNRSNAGRWVTINAPRELVEQAHAVIAAATGEQP